jgi:hypothetical protein
MQIFACDLALVPKEVAYHCFEGLMKMVKLLAVVFLKRNNCWSIHRKYE